MWTKLSKDSYNRHLDFYYTLPNNQRLYIYGQKEFGYTYNNKRYDIEIDRIRITDIV